MLVAKDNLTYPGAPNADPGTTAKLSFSRQKVEKSTSSLSPSLWIRP